MFASALFALVSASVVAADVYGGQIHPSVNLHKCVDIPGNNQQNGQRIQLYDCNGTGAQAWDVPSNEGQIKLSNTNFCLDAGRGPADGTRLFISTCDPNATGQTWVPGNGGTFKLKNSNFCMDLNNDNTDNGNKIQTWNCADGSWAQQWAVDGQ